MGNIRISLINDFKVKDVFYMTVVARIKEKLDMRELNDFIGGDFLSLAEIKELQSYPHIDIMIPQQRINVPCYVGGPEYRSGDFFNIGGVRGSNEGDYPITLKMLLYSNSGVDEVDWECSLYDLLYELKDDLFDIEDGQTYEVDAENFYSHLANQTSLVRGLGGSMSGMRDDLDYAPDEFHLKLHHFVVDERFIAEQLGVGVNGMAHYIDFKKLDTAPNTAQLFKHMNELLVSTPSGKHSSTFMRMYQGDYRKMHTESLVGSLALSTIMIREQIGMNTFKLGKTDASRFKQLYQRTVPFFGEYIKKQYNKYPMAATSMSITPTIAIPVYTVKVTQKGKELMLIISPFIAYVMNLEDGQAGMIYNLQTLTLTECYERAIPYGLAAHIEACDLRKNTSLGKVLQ